MFTPEQISLIKKTCVPNDASDEHIEWFLYVAEKYGLDPLTKEIVLEIRTLKNGGKRPVIITTRDGYLKAAMRQSEYNGVNGGVVRAGDLFEIDPVSGVLKHRFGEKRGEIIAGWAIAKAKGRDPIIFTADFSEYSKANSQSYTWKDYPSAMIQKVAEIGAMRRQFNITGMVGEEEMPTDTEIEIIEIEDLKDSPIQLPVPEPTPEPTPEPAPEPAPEPTPESSPEPAMEKYVVVLTGRPAKKKGKEILVVPAVIFDASEEEEGIELEIPASYAALLAAGAVLDVVGRLNKGILVAESASPVEGGEGKAEDKSDRITLLESPRKGHFAERKKETIFFTRCEYCEGYSEIFVVGDALAPFNLGDVLSVTITDREEKNGKLIIYISDAQAIAEKVS